jgi:hypothetical protein
MAIPVGIASIISIRSPVRVENFSQVVIMDGFLDRFPSSVEKVVAKLATDMTFADKTRLANMSEVKLIAFHQAYGVFLRTEFRLPGNELLMQSCLSKTNLGTITPEQASFIILKELQKQLQAGNTLKVISSRFDKSPGNR